ncbi:MAG: DNA-3-methyladenine glycosylase I [Deltaproteobacteria bacterium]|nr:DNA-3-methyladenine glycosylase I [Deltaproteobacteria bacterium]
MKQRCKWTGSDPVYVKYHDTEWGVPVHDDRTLFEFLVLEGAQSGLSWITILKKRNNFAKAFAGFDPETIAEYNQDKIEALMQNKSIIRNRLKIESVVRNAKLFLDIQQEFNSFNDYIWMFTGGKPKKNAWRHEDEIPVATKESSAMSKDLKKRGFKFVGPVICYAFMQAVGMVNDHIIDCFRYNEIYLLTHVPVGEDSP